MPAADCAAGIADALADDGFEYYVPPVYPGGIGAKDLAIAKVTDCDNFMRGMADMAPDGWQEMVCVETANVADNSVHLASGASHKLAASIRVE